MIFSERRVLGTMSFKQLIFDDIEEIVLPADIVIDPSGWDVEAPQDPRFQIAKKMDDFVAKVADVSLLVAIYVLARWTDHYSHSLTCVGHYA